MRHDDRVFVAHMVEFARKAHERVAWRERDELDGDEDLQLEQDVPRCHGRTSSGCATSSSAGRCVVG